MRVCWYVYAMNVRTIQNIEENSYIMNYDTSFFPHAVTKANNYLILLHNLLMNKPKLIHTLQANLISN